MRFKNSTPWQGDDHPLFMKSKPKGRGEGLALLGRDDAIEHATRVLDDVVVNLSLHDETLREGEAGEGDPVFVGAAGDGSEAVL